MSIQECTLEITDIALPDSYGVGKDKDLVIFVPGAIVGDRVKVRIERRNKRFAYGRIAAIEKASAFRIEPYCPHFGLCGGCTLQNLDYEKQLEIKENHLRQTLRRIGSIEADPASFASVTPSPDRWSYRTKLELAFGDEKGRLVLGLRERVSPFEPYRGRVVPLKGCPVFGKTAEIIIPLMEERMRALGLEAYNPKRKRGLLKHLIIREAKQTGQLMLILETASVRLPDLSALWRKVTAEAIGVKSFYGIVNDADNDVINYSRQKHLFGEPFIEEGLGPFRFILYPASFFQPNHGAASLLYEEITRLSKLSRPENVLGLYCGMGPIEINLSRIARRVTGIDVVAANIANARENCGLNGIDNCFFFEGEVEKVLAKERSDRIDLVITDPPRTGISDSGIKEILDLKSRNIIYVSCNPSTLARDLKLFLANGYHVERIVPFDFFPHTGHMETLVVLSQGHNI